ncbi:hypothetical protein CASFOL_011205 [Castilleja foliolosa]|uniref:Smr domain-containing protein n=1 Tax=Castilleja foliolosa TaxID=1961234 RepID=A0ABD3DUV0_9LAMI
MYSPGKGGVSSKATLNPNASEFVPFALRSPSAASISPGASSKFPTYTPPTDSKSALDLSESSVSINSDDEAHQYWRHQLPDDITPDFKAMGIDDNAPEPNTLPFSSLLLTDINEGSRYSPRTANVDKMRYGDFPSPKGFHPALGKPWAPEIASNDLLPNVGNSRNGLLGELSNEQLFLDNNNNPDVNPVEFLASQFPGFSAESLTEVYFANAGDLNLTIDMLTQLERQVDGGLNQSLNSKALSAPNLTAVDFPALSARDGHRTDLANFASDGLDQKQGASSLFRSNSFIPSRGATDFASAVRKMAPQDSSIWKYERNGSSDSSIGSSRSSQALASSFNGGQTRNVYGDRFQSRGAAHMLPTWLETGETVANMYSEMREEARDHARVRNAYFEQARQAYLIGNKALAKELSIKGQLHNMQMKEAHGKAQETIYRQRNSDIQTNGRERMIDLHGLHVSEAIHVLKRELAVMRNVARSMDQRLPVYICVGTGHHTRGARTPARLPTAVQHYLLEEEGLDFSEPQSGLLWVVIY